MTRAFKKLKVGISARRHRLVQPLMLVLLLAWTGPSLAEITVQDGGFLYRADAAVSLASVGSESEQALAAGETMLVNVGEHVVIRSGNSKTSLIPLGPTVDADVLAIARKLIGFWPPETVRNAAVLVLEQFAPELPLATVCRVLVINDQVGDGGRQSIELLEAAEGIDVRYRLKQTEMGCQSRAVAGGQG